MRTDIIPRTRRFRTARAHREISKELFAVGLSAIGWRWLAAHSVGRAGRWREYLAHLGDGDRVASLRGDCAGARFRIQGSIDCVWEMEVAGHHCTTGRRRRVSFPAQRAGFAFPGCHNVQLLVHDGFRARAQRRPCIQAMGPRGNVRMTVSDTVTRRRALIWAGTLSLSALCRAAEVSADKGGTTTSPPLSAADLLGARLTSKVPRRPRDDGSSLRNDLAYPPHFLGRWRVTSAVVEVAAPAGATLFGGPDAYDSARAQIDERPLEYEARFVRQRTATGADSVVSDRVFNVERIAEAAMGGRGSVLSCYAEDFNLVTAVVRPAAAGGTVFEAALSALSRRSADIERGLFNEPSSALLQSAPGERVFLAQEFVRQSIRVSPGPNSTARPRSRSKEIDTVTAYIYSDDPDVFVAQQRTITYIPREDIRSTEALGRPVDVRTYELRYTRLR